MWTNNKEVNKNCDLPKVCSEKFSRKPINASITELLNKLFPWNKEIEKPLSEIETTISYKLSFLNSQFLNNKEALKAFQIISDNYKTFWEKQKKILSELLWQIHIKATDENFIVNITERFWKFVIRAENTSLQIILNKLKNDKYFDFLKKYWISIQIQYWTENYGK